jgi:ubiquitin-conjugating enzyme E2 variant
MIFLTFALQLLGGWLLADFISGVVRWLDDRFEPIPFRGPALVMLATFVGGGLSLGLLGVHPWILATMFGCLMASKAQSWADDAMAGPAWVLVLHATLLLKRPYKTPVAPELDYCMLTGWLNPILRKVRFWQILDTMTTWGK